MCFGYRVRGLCFEKLAKYNGTDGKESPDNQINLVKASTAYLLALQGLPGDEEIHYCKCLHPQTLLIFIRTYQTLYFIPLAYLYRSLNAAWKAHAPPAAIISLLKTYHQTQSSYFKPLGEHRNSEIRAAWAYGEGDQVS